MGPINPQTHDRELFPVAMTFSNTMVRSGARSLDLIQATLMLKEKEGLKVLNV